MKASDVPTKFNIPFASSAGGSYVRVIPEASQIGIQDGAASLTDGFPPDCFLPVGAGGIPPFGQDFNGILKETTLWSRWQSAGAPIAYDSTFATAIGGYPKGAIVAATTFGYFWLCSTDDNLSDPEAGGAGWILFWPLASQSGGFINGFRNATFGVWTRGVSGTVTVNTAPHTADGWVISAGGADIPWLQTSGLGKTRYALLLSCASGITSAILEHRIESYVAAKYASQTCTVQFKIKNNTGAAVVPNLSVSYANVVDAFSALTGSLGPTALQSCPDAATTTVSYTFTGPALAANGMQVNLDFGNSLNAGTGSLTIGEPDIRVTPNISIGLNANPPTPELRSISAEVVECYRFLPWIGGSVTEGWSGFMGQAFSTTNAVIAIPFSYPARVPPTGATLTGFKLLDASGTIIAGSGQAFRGATVNGAVIEGGGFSGLTPGQATMLLGTTGGFSFLFTGAEL